MRIAFYKISSFQHNKTSGSFFNHHRGAIRGPFPIRKMNASYLQTLPHYTNTRVRSKDI